jgi:hypothetical protein
MIYRFSSENTFTKWKDSELKLFVDDDKGAICFAKVRGIPNPWFVHPIVDGKIDKTKIIKYNELHKILKKFFK